VNRVVAEQILQMMGLSNVAVENGEAVIDRFKAIRPGLVRMDVSMPIMNGYDATRQIREIEQAQGLDRTPIIGLTANAMQGDREKCLEAGADDYLAKPISTAKLTAMIESWIGSKSKAETSAAASAIPEQGASDLAAE
ncbi:MAG: response regulator, partial [Boseongicola sp.]